MKKSLVLAMAMALGVTASAYAANPFSDVPAGHWAYDSVAKLAAAGVVDGYADGAFDGDKLMTRYEMAQIVAKAMAKGADCDKLAAEFADELDTLGVRVAKLEKGADAVKITGQVRARYVDSAATGIVKFEVSGPEQYVLYVDVINGVAVLHDLLKSGDYNVVATYMGDDKFNANMTSSEFTISDKQKEETNATINIPSDIKVGEDVLVEVSIPGATGNVSVIVDGKETVVVLDENGKVIGYIAKDGKVYDFNGYVIGFVNENGEVMSSRGVKIGAVIKKDFIALSPNGYSLGVINNKGEVVNSLQEVIGKVLPNSLIKATEGKNIIGKAVIGGKAVGWGCKQYGYVDKDGKVKKDGKDTGYRMLFDRSIVDNNGKYVGDIVKIGWVRDDKCNIIGQAYSEGFVKNNKGEYIGCVNPDGGVINNGK